MESAIQPSYVPALRMKAGELAGLCDLAPEVADRILPRIIVPPADERDDALQAQLFNNSESPNIADSLARHWRGRRVLVEITHLIPDLDCGMIGRWLPKMFERANRMGVPSVPLVKLADLTTGSREAYRAACSSGSIQMAILISSDDLIGPDSLAPLLRHLDAMRVCPSDCLVIADFGGSHFANPEVVTPIIGGALELLQEMGVWGHIVFQGTNYPDKNPAQPGRTYRVPRNEWKSWRKAVGFDPATAQHMIFGDYAADCATMSFGAGGGRAIRHYRYAISDAWIVERGSDIGADAIVMRDVCRRIVGSGEFAGRNFSSADEFIFLSAYGDVGPGIAAKWRAVNTTHHITRVVTDISAVCGFALRQRPPKALPTQEDLFAVPRAG